MTVDSGASDTVVPPTVCRAAKLVKGDKFGIEYEIANGETIENLGERQCLMRTAEGDSDASMEMRFQVVDVSKSLLSVHRVCEMGHAVLFSKDGSAILVGGNAEQCIPLRHSGGTYEIDVWLKPSQDFGRPR